MISSQKDERMTVCDLKLSTHTSSWQCRSSVGAMPTEATAEVAAPRTNSEPPPVSTTNGNSPTAQFFPSDNVRPPAFLLNDENAERLSELRRLNKEFLGPRFTSITVAEGLARELRERQPFQGSRSATISEATMLAKEADRELESAKLQVKACNNDIAVQHAKNVEAAAECKALRLGSLPGQNEVTRKRKLVEEGVEKLLSGATESQKFVGEDLRITLATSEGCKQMLDRQMAAMQDVKKEKETAIENSSKLKAEIAPLRKAVKKLRTTFAFNASITPESDSTSSAEKRDSEAIDHEIRDMCMWYTEANALISGVSGVTMDTAQSFGATTARINIHGCDHVSEGDSADVNTLIVHFEPDSTRVCGAEVGTRSMNNESTLLICIVPFLKLRACSLSQSLTLNKLTDHWFYIILSHEWNGMDAFIVQLTKA